MSVDSLRVEVRQWAQTAEFHALAFMEDNEPDEPELAEAIPGFMDVYAQTAALLTADWYNSMDKESRYFARPFAEIAPERLAATASWVFKGPQTPANRMRSAAHGIVFDASRNTVVSNADTEGVAIVRHEHADACDDCAQLATKRPMARNSSSEGVGRDFHHHCEGLLIPVRRGIWAPPDYTKAWL